MRPADGKVFELLGDHVARRLLEVLAKDGTPRTQAQLGRETPFHSGTISNRLAVLEEAGLVTRSGSRAPYELTFRDTTFELIQVGKQLAALGLTWRADQASRLAAEFQRSDDLDAAPQSAEERVA